MTTYSKLNFVYRLQKWMDSVAGQTFLNYAYSWGASIVILGTLFKLTHLPGANFFLFLGMGTEVFVFFISAFDRPFDKTTDGMDLDIHMEEGDAAPAVGAGNVAPAVAGGGTIVINGGGGTIGGVVGNGDEAARWEGGPTNSGAEGGTISFAGGVVGGGGTIGGGTVVSGGGTVVSGSPADVVPTMGDEMKEATSNYIDELNRLTEMLAEVSAQSQRLTRDSEEMENLNRTLTGISRVYEMQLKSASAQISTIDEINEQTRHMAEQIIELNKIYARMIEAMQVRMPQVPQ
jgi:hypothetical protein